MSRYGERGTIGISRSVWRRSYKRPMITATVPATTPPTRPRIAASLTWLRVFRAQRDRTPRAARCTSSRAGLNTQWRTCPHECLCVRLREAPEIRLYTLLRLKQVRQPRDAAPRVNVRAVHDVDKIRACRLDTRCIDRAERRCGGRRAGHNETDDQGGGDEAAKGARENRVHDSTRSVALTRYIHASELINAGPPHAVPGTSEF